MATPNHGFGWPFESLTQLGLFLPRQLMAVCREGFTVGIAGTATRRIHMTSTTRFSCRSRVGGQRGGGFRNGNHQRSTDDRRDSNSPQYPEIHICLPDQTWPLGNPKGFLVRKIDLDQHRRSNDAAKAQKSSGLPVRCGKLGVTGG
jgi:hypothetical protein